MNPFIQRLEVKIFFENVNFSSSSGPNGFAVKLRDEFLRMGEEITYNHLDSDVRLCFIRMLHKSPIPIVQRLDGISFNSSVDYRAANRSVEETYREAKSVIFQSNFDKRVVGNFFGERENCFVINNGTPFRKINEIPPSLDYSDFSQVWSCAANWKGRPHKRLDQNIKYFIENSGEKDCLVVMGKVSQKVDSKRIFYLGEVKWDRMIAVMKASSKFIHLALVDHCPNVVVDAKSCGCQIICNSISGTHEISGSDAVIVEDGFDWDYRTPFDYRRRHDMEFSSKRGGGINANLDIKDVAKRYLSVTRGVI
jgi:glycosyltransferase involved in cell wall biosynthesis